ncbi:protein argonaute-2-like [Anticarsia gemmatalis]|uniref:protein argonaute-2-like n=1 Tax=Anticarsia gemmatalis TaxID=129554 RepID=UPI003F776597
MPKGGRKKGHKSESHREETPSQSDITEPTVQEEEEGLELGAGSRRKQKKKQKQEALQQLLTTSTSHGPSSSREHTEPPAPAPETRKAEAEKSEEITEEFEGLGLGGPKKKKPKRKKTDAADASRQISSPEQLSSPSQMSTPSQVSSPPQISSPSPGHSLKQMQPSSTFPPGFVRSTPSEQGHVPAGAWGRGRGRPTAGAPRAAPPAFHTSPSTPQFPQQPQQHAQSRPQPTMMRPTNPRPTGEYSQDNVVCRYKIPSKVPGRSVGGRNLTVLTNYLEMTFKSLNISRYDVSFTPDRPKKMIPMVFKKVKDEFYPDELLAFDQTKNCYSLRPLRNVPATERFNTTVDMEDSNGRTIRFEVSIKATGVVELDKIKRYMAEGGASIMHPTEEVQCIDVILRQGTLESYVKAGRQFFRRPMDPIDLGHGYEMWTGLFQSAIFTSKAFINIDVAHKGFPKHQTMIESLVKDFRLDPHSNIENQRSFEVDNFMHFIRGLKVVATLVGDCPSSGQKREYICNGLVDPPGKVKFLLNEPDGKQRQITVGEYFAKEKKYHIKYPHLNCVWVGPKEKSIYFPMELLEIAYGQPLARQLNETQVSKMVREAATPPDKRLRKITEVISSMKYSTNRDFKRFGLEISDKFYQVNARVLEPPLLDVGRGNTVPRKGMWQANGLLKPEALLSWGFIGLETDPRNDFDNVIQMLISTGKQMGMNIAEPTCKKFDVKLMSLSNLLRGALDRGIRFIFVVVSTRGRDHYHRVKQMAEREIGILTQCVKEATTRRMNMMTAKNILLKVNSKLMGINQALGDKTMPRCLKDGGVMIVGADVTHPSPEQSNVPSIAAVTASIDSRCYMYNIELSVQTPKKEMIVEFEDMMFDHLKVYKERNMNQLPHKIFVFRDGVSEGQFVQVMNSELAAVHAAYRRMAGSTRKPEILFLLVQKRHHTRFFNRGENSQYNVEPGTVVDTDIVHASELDFYLVSHQALKGTARPTRYHAVCNDGRIPDDEVEQLTYYLCHLYSRCMRSVSYPTPTYYAHLACLRARSLTHGQKFNNKELEKKPERLHVLDKMLQYSRMFFV